MWLTPNAPDAGIVGRVLLIPSVYASAVNGALEALSEEYNWEAFGTETPAAAASLMRDMIDAYYASEVTIDISGGLTSVPVWRPISAPNGWAFGADAAAFGAGVFSFSNTNQNNEVSWGVPLGAGTWELSGLATFRSAAGIVTWAIDGSTIGTTDTYLAAITRNSILSLSGIVVTTGGRKVIRAKMLTKNAAAAAYGLNLQFLALRQTA